MNTTQERILIAVILLVAGMLLYPPFQRVASNGATYNMGYGWIFDPPGRDATVNVAILLMQWVGVLVVGGLGFFLAKGADPSTNSQGPKGVGGWLLLLVAGMLAIGPLLGAARVGSAMFFVEAQFPALKTMGEWGAYKTVMWLAFFAFAALSVYGGWGLLRGKDWSMVGRAKTVLWLVGPGGSLVLGVLIPKMTLSESNIDGGVVGGFIASVLSAAIWTAYLSKSKRVRNTYSDPAVSGDIPHEIVGNLPAITAKVTTTLGNSGPAVPSNSATHESDDWAYERISEEIESGNRDKATWTRAFANTGGDDKQTTALYIKLRVEKLKAIEEAAETNAANQIEEVIPSKCDAPAVDQVVSESNIVTPITIGVAMGALILLVVVFGAKLSGALGPTPAPAPAGGGTVSAPSIPTLLSPQEMRPGKVFKDCADCPEMVIVPAGSFEMGSNADECEEKPVHTVRIGKPFAMGKTEVTQGQWRSIMGSNPSRFSSCGDDCPVEGVSWNDAKTFIERLSGKTGKTYRLPSESEWEYACRAGGTHTYCGGENIDSVAWYKSNSGNKTHSVATKQANAWGLHDMSGNVSEWVEDCLSKDYYGAPTDGSARTSGGCERRVVRGGSWYSQPRPACSAFRFFGEASGLLGNFSSGIRLARMLQ